MAKKFKKNPTRRVARCKRTEQNKVELNRTEQGQIWMVRERSRRLQGDQKYQNWSCFVRFCRIRRWSRSWSRSWRWSRSQTQSQSQHGCDRCSGSGFGFRFVLTPLILFLSKCWLQNIIGNTMSYKTVVNVRCERLIANSIDIAVNNSCCKVRMLFFHRHCSHQLFRP